MHEDAIYWVLAYLYFVGSVGMASYLILRREGKPLPRSFISSTVFWPVFLLYRLIKVLITNRW